MSEVRGKKSNFRGEVALQYDLLRYAKSIENKGNGQEFILAGLIIEYCRLADLSCDLNNIISKLNVLEALHIHQVELDQTPIGMHKHIMMASLFDSALVMYARTTTGHGKPVGIDLKSYLTSEQSARHSDLTELRNKAVAHRVADGPKERDAHNYDTVVFEFGKGIARFGRRASYREELVESMRELTIIAIAEINRQDFKCEKDLSVAFQKVVEQSSSKFVRDIMKFKFDPNHDTGSSMKLYLNGTTEWSEPRSSYHK